MDEFFFGKTLSQCSVIDPLRNNKMLNSSKLKTFANNETQVINRGLFW